MKRLTIRDGRHIEVNCGSCPNSGKRGTCHATECWGEAGIRLAAIEDILGDDYDLDRLRCAVESLAEAEAANTQLDGVATTLMESNRKLAESLEAEKARADDAETALTAAVRDMEAMALTIRQRRDHDTECCPFCHYDCPEEDYCPGWEGEECFRWRGK